MDRSGRPCRALVAGDLREGNAGQSSRWGPSHRHRPPQVGEPPTPTRLRFPESYRPFRGSFSSAIAAWYTNAATTTAFFFRSSIGRVS